MLLVSTSTTLRLTAAVMCERPASIDSGTFVLIDGSTMMGSSVLYKCKKGYNLVGQASATCLNSGVWSEVPPSCSGNARKQIKSCSFSKGCFISDRKRICCSSSRVCCCTDA